MKPCKASYKIVRDNGSEIFKGFGFKHLDATQYYVHPNNQSFKEKFTVIRENEQAAADTHDVRVISFDSGEFSEEYRELIPQLSEEFILPKNSCSSWDTMKLTTRSQDIHECLHIIYSKFPPTSEADKRSTTKSRLKTLSLIGNILEDAYIEIVGASVYDNTEMFLKRVLSEGAFPEYLSQVHRREQSRGIFPKRTSTKEMRKS